MQPDCRGGRLYKGGTTVADSPVAQADGVRLFEKQREQLAQMAASRGTAPGFAEREGNRGRVVHEWAEESRVQVAIEEISDEEYDDEELDLEPAAGVEGGCSSRLAEAAQGSPQQRLKDEAASASQKFGMYSFLNSFASAAGAQGNGGENGIGGVSAAQAGRGTAGFASAQSLQARAAEASNGAQGKEQSLRHFLCDPVSGTLMEDAVIFPCGHSVGTAGYQKVEETNACVICFQQTNPMSATPNHALREVVHAFKVERELPNSTSTRLAKRRREDDHQPADTGKPKGVQFPYSVSDRVLIKGNKRTPERFVGREAIITTQCLNGWYLVRTIDNGESVRLQYRSLQKL